MIRILQGDCREILARLPSASVQCCVTSPPYFGLRDYGIAEQIGLEATPEAFVLELVAVFRHVRRVLRDDGTLWLNLGDSYAGSGRGGGADGSKQQTNVGSLVESDAQRARKRHEISDAQRKNVPGRCESVPGAKPKDLLGIPWRLAFALQADGWYLRQDIIWSKPNPMPESVQDRCTKAHEYLFLLSKSPVYHYEMAAIAEAATDSTAQRLAQDIENQAGSDRVPGKTNGPMKAVKGRTVRPGVDTNGGGQGDGVMSYPALTRNKRSVWTVATQPFKEAHFATFPPALIEPCILAGCPPGGVVLDPFGGAGTTALVADRLQRDAILIELNPTYAAMAEARIRGDSPLFADVAAAA